MRKVSLDEVSLTSLSVNYPYVLIDRLLECDENNKVFKAFKNTSNTEKYYSGHFPGDPVMPGVLIISAFRQLASLFYGEDRIRLKSVDKLRFQHPVRPGERLMLTMNELEQTEGTIVLHCLAEVDGKVCVKGKMTCSVNENNGGVEDDI